MIQSSDLVLRLSGGSSNSNANTSLGGVKSSNAISAGNLFDNVSASEALAGSTEYRCVYLHNSHASLSLLASKVFIQTNTPSPSTTVAIGLGTSGLNGTEQTVANETTAPSGVTFSTPSDFANGLSMGDIPAGQHYAIWIRRTVSASASAYSDSFTIAVQGESNP